MTERLKEELARIGDSVAPVYVAPDTWARGRRARRRDRVLVGAAALVLIAMVGGGVGLVRHESRETQPVEPADSDLVALPSRIWKVPEHVADQDQDGQWTGPVETDLAMGPASVAFVAAGRLPVLIGASDGRYHLLDLPGWLGEWDLYEAEGGIGVGLALSPDGTRLAYAWHGELPTSSTAPVPTGIRIIDLTTGKGRVALLSGGQGVVTTRLMWSPDGRWLAWTGLVAGHLSGAPSSAWYDAHLGGRINVTTMSAEKAKIRDSSAGLSINNDGTTAWLDRDRLAVWDGRHLTKRKIAFPNGLLDTPPTGAWSPDATSIAFGTFGSNAGLIPVEVATATNRQGLLLPDPPARDNLRRVQPLGWIDDTRVLAMVEQELPGRRAVSLVVISTPETRADDRLVTTTDFVTGEFLSVAVDLIDLDHPTADFPEPDWPWSTERQMVVGFGAAVGILWAGYWLFRWRRRLL